ncbi:MAG: hypothetical protein RBU37_09915 [Myxococcota bacterium]|nr:hypothetical protein [Myxococcota bacterium]
MNQRRSNLKAHIVSLATVGGVLLFAFFLYLVVVLFGFLSEHPQLLVYAFLLLLSLQAYWLLFAYLKRRFAG